MLENQETETLITDFLNGKKHAYDVLHKKYFGEIYAFCFSLVANKEVAEDITQETMIKLWIKHKDFDSLPNIRAFLYITSRNACMDHFRYISSEKEGKSRFKLAFDDFVTINDQLDGLYRQSIKTLLTKLPDRQKQAIELLFFEELKLREAAREMEISVDTVKKLRARGITLLREILRSQTSAEVVLLLMLTIDFVIVSFTGSKA